MEMGRNNANGNHKVGNVNVQIGDKEGIYAGSATNMARLPPSYNERKTKWK